MRRLLALAATALLAAGCAAPPSLPNVAHPQQVWEVRQHALAALSAWQLSGRIAVRNGDDAWQGNLEWRQAGSDYHIAVDGPFGQSQFDLTGGAQGVVLRTADNKVWQASDPEALLLEQTGIRMPVNALRYWVRGLPDPAGEPAQTLDGRGRLARLQQGGWSVQFRRYTQVDGLELPDKLFVQRGPVDIRLVVDRWRLPAAELSPASAPRRD